MHPAVLARTGLTGQFGDERARGPIGQLAQKQLHQLDVGEAVAQSLALAIDPFAVGPDAERARQQAGLLDEGQAGPFAALAALKRDTKE